jgi:hypothetical protein
VNLAGVSSVAKQDQQRKADRQTETDRDRLFFFFLVIEFVQLEVGSISEFFDG